jgi:hypothetical protein
MKIILFRGSGGLYNYMLGILLYMQQNYNTSNYKYIGYSSGCFSALICCLGLDVKEMFYKWNIPMLKDIDSLQCKCYFNWNDYVKKYTLQNLPKNAYIKASGKLFILVSIISNGKIKHKFFTKWYSNEDLVNCMIASSFIPFYDKCLLYKYRKYYCFDGGYVAKNISFNKCNFICNSDLFYKQNIKDFFCSSNINKSIYLFEKGFSDSYNNKNFFQKLI